MDFGVAAWAGALYGHSQFAVEVLSGPAFEPVPVDGADGLRAWCKVDLEGEGDTLRSLAQAAVTLIEREYDLSLTLRTLRLSLDRWHQPIRLPGSPATALLSVDYDDPNGVVQTLDPSGYILDLKSHPALLWPPFGGWWPSFRPDHDAVRVTYQVGYPTAAQVPAPLRLAVKVCVRAWYEGRADGTVPEGARRLVESCWHGRLG